MWNQLSVGSKRFISRLGIAVGALSVVAAFMCALSQEWGYAATFLFAGVWGILSSFASLKAIRE